MTQRSVLFAGLAGLLLAACSTVTDTGFSTGSVSSADLIAFTGEGVAGLPGDVRYSAEAIEAALPGFDASDITMATEERMLSGLAVFKDGLQVLQVVPSGGGRIAAIHGVSTRIRGPNGERIGMTLPETRVSRADCREGTDNWRGMPLCRARGAPNVTLVFAIPGYVSENQLPDDATLAGATLQRIIWSPASGVAS